MPPVNLWFFVGRTDQLIITKLKTDWIWYRVRISKPRLNLACRISKSNLAQVWEILKQAKFDDSDTGFASTPLQL